MQHLGYFRLLVVLKYINHVVFLRLLSVLSLMLQLQGIMEHLLEQLLVELEQLQVMILEQPLVMLLQQPRVVLHQRPLVLPF